MILVALLFPGETPMELAEILFWLFLFCVAYPYIIYPSLLMFLAAIKGKPKRLHRFTGSFSIVVAAYNEEKSVGRRLTELTNYINASGFEGEIIIVSDGSTDRTAEIARQHAPSVVRVLELPTNCGKAAALTAGCAAARNEIIVFADARQSWDPQALGLLLENFSDPSVGAVSGELVLESSPGILTGVGLYWRYEKWVRRNESAVYSTVGVTGAISAVRRALFRAVPQGTILDDVYWPLQVAMQGFRVVHDCRARAFDLLPDKVSGEFRRKLRTLSGNYQLLARLPSALLPWRNPIWFQFFSHKVFRLVVPWTLLGLLGLSVLLEHSVYRIALYAQLLAYGVALVGIWRRLASRSRVVAAASSFLILNVAAWVAFWVWLSGRAARTWHKVSYRPSKQLAVASTASAVIVE
jgi:cellulose synthase/poly-beta-1,6-N-acetylglucosamine synthase-like glycosyltransferase